MGPGLPWNVQIIDEEAPACQEPRILQPSCGLPDKGRHSEPEFAGETIAPRQFADLVPGRVLYRDAVLASVLLLPELDLTGIKDLREPLRSRRCLQVVSEFGNFLLECLQRAKSRHVEDGDEAAIVVASSRFDTETKSGQQPGQDFHDRRQAGALVAFGAA